jgi:hypothetical protein
MGHAVDKPAPQQLGCNPAHHPARTPPIAKARLGRIADESIFESPDVMVALGRKRETLFGNLVLVAGKRREWTRARESLGPPAVPSLRSKWLELAIGAPAQASDASASLCRAGAATGAQTGFNHVAWADLGRCYHRRKASDRRR